MSWSCEIWKGRKGYILGHSACRKIVESILDSLDILHVAAALLLGADRFLTFDECQSGLAALERLRLVHTA